MIASEVGGDVEKRLRRLELQVRLRLDGMVRGQYLGLLPGPGTELEGAREYRAGEDDARFLDWAVTARTSVPHVRQTTAERELVVNLLVDATASMDFGTAAMEKRELAVGAAAAVGILTAGIGNRIAAQVMTADGVRRLPPGTGRRHLLQLLKVLAHQPRAEHPKSRSKSPAPPMSTGSSGARTLADGLNTLGRSAQRRGMAVVVSDFLESDDADGRFGWERELRRLAVRHTVLVIEVLDPRELSLPDIGVVTLIDPETGRRREVATHDRKLRKRYAQEAERHREAVRAAVRRSGATHLRLRTDRDWVADIARHALNTRRRSA